MNLLPFLSVFCGLLLPAAAAWPLASALCRPGRTGLLPWLAAFPLGYGLLTAGLFLLNLLCGVRMGLGAGAGILACVFLGGLWARRKWGGRQEIRNWKLEIVEGQRQPRAIQSGERMHLSPHSKTVCASATRCIGGRWERWLLCVVIGAAAMVWVWRLVPVVSGPVGMGDIPGLGVWGCKALAIADSGQIPWELLCDRERPYLNQSYPLGYPLLLAWGHWCAGGFNDCAIRLLPYLSGLLIFLMLAVMLREAGLPPWIALSLALAPCCGDVFGYCTWTLYAETTLLLFLLPGVWLAQRHLRERAAADLWLGVLLLGMAAWIKQEGMFFLVVVLLWLLLDGLQGFGYRRKEWRELAGAVVVTAALFVVPWACCRWALGVPLYDFALARPWEAGWRETLHVLGLGWRNGADWMFLDLKATGGLWILALALLAARLLRSPLRGSGVGFAWFIAVASAAFFMSLYIFSVRELAWHMDSSLPRLLLVAGMCAMALGAGALAPSKNMGITGNKT